MGDTRKGFAALVAFAVVALTSPAASAISADLAKKCRELAIKAHPTQPAGTKSGTEGAQGLLPAVHRQEWRYVEII